LELPLLLQGLHGTNTWSATQQELLLRQKTPGMDESDQAVGGTACDGQLIKLLCFWRWRWRARIMCGDLTVLAVHQCSKTEMFIIWSATRNMSVLKPSASEAL
jgi:hypothetical protein